MARRSALRSRFSSAVSTSRRISFKRDSRIKPISSRRINTTAEEPAMTSSANAVQPTQSSRDRVTLTNRLNHTPAARPTRASSAERRMEPHRIPR